MRTLLRASGMSLALVVACSLAYASDAPRPSAAPYSWSGVFVGAQGGYAWGVEDDDLDAVLAAPADHFRAEGPLGGARVGYDRQFGALVIGFVGEIDATNQAGATTDGAKVCETGCKLTEASLKFQNKWQGYLLGRAGVAFDRLLVFAEGGLSLGDDDESMTATQVLYPPNSNRPPTLLGAWDGSRRQTLAGGALGLGAEYALDDHWRVGSEWRLAEFARGNDPANLVYSGHGGVSAATYKAGFSENLAVLDLSYRF